MPEQIWLHELHERTCSILILSVTADRHLLAVQICCRMLMRQLLCFELGGSIYAVLFSHILIETPAGPDRTLSFNSCNLSSAG